MCWRTGAAAAVCIELIFLTGCTGSYAGFHLPVLVPGGAKVSYQWQALPSPVISLGDKGEWDGVDALNPSVVRFGNRLYNVYSGYDGATWRTGIAVSLDGIIWTKQGKVLAPDRNTWEGDYIAANGTALQVAGELFYWYQGNRTPRIGLARSQDAIAWKKHPSPVLDPGPRGSWDERGVADPYVIRAEDRYYMYYLGQDRAQRQRLGVARSTDGVHWEKSLANPLMDLGGPGAFDEIGLGEPAVWQWNGSYWMLYTGRDRAENRRLGLARSQDGVHWTRVTDGPVFAGETAWDSKVVCDPTVLPDGDSVRVWFGGGDMPQPAENLHGQIGLATLHLKLEGAQ